MSFALTGKESIVVYGAGSQGKRFIEIFHKNGFQIKAVLDKNAEKINPLIVNSSTVQVIAPEQYVMQSQDEIVIISFWNALWHEKVISVLQNIGFEKIIFIPTSISGDRNLMSVMRRIFNEILDGKVFLDGIPEYADIVGNTDRNIVVDNHVYMPAELLFSEENFAIPMEELTGTELLKRRNVMKTSGENIANLTTYYQLYKYLDKSEGECDEYLCTQMDSFAIDIAEEKKKILKDRYDLFQVFERAFALDRNFFEDSAPKVIWNRKGYFNIVDGHHRAAYLFYKGVRDIPVRVCEEDKVHLKMLESIPNIFFSESIPLIDAENSLFWRKKNTIICSSLMKKDVVGRRIYTNLDDAGYIARYCCRVGCKQCIDVETEEKYIFAKQMCDIFQYSDFLEVCNGVEGNTNVDIAIIDEECISDFKGMYASQYIIKLESRRGLYDKIVQEKIKYSLLGEAFDGEKAYLFIQMEGDSVCFL